MALVIPRIVTLLVYHHDAWIVGSAADPKATDPRDWDVIVPFSRWQEASALIPQTADVNSFGGWKVFEEGTSIDVWPGDLGWLMRKDRALWAWCPSTGCRLMKVTDE